ncbi:YafY family transcriptional regulator [Amycolatopsis acidiphila]|uniref:YafY family transcriptional regulator n=1 Tax=Amycolatopsis acidiphila TaxID=715473 RepID=A0A557ZWE0_9PSEU|nr:YafY family protein [Amycolatopsis acidiphila]TVT16327.1 YafY family transcriptional regulator [Amycolatopsis acidiphila]UIJ61210.1 YafY family transcriptional regulator [Amycolatopsis acidiphila]GHG97797.1 transcriptional regulator [Amycolatopsis acidiphila]
MTHPLIRVLALLELLQAHAGLTGTELAGRLGTDVRTVRRYVAHLRELGIPVEAGRGRHGGYRLARGYRMPPLVLSNDEALAVVLGLLAGERLGMNPAAPAGAGALAKIERVLPDALREPLAAMRDTLGFTAHTVTGRAPEAGVLLALAQASRRGRSVGLRYESWRGEQTERDLDPYGVVFHAGRWYVTGHDHLRGTLRTFRIDRIASVVPGSGAFVAPAGFDPVARVASSLARAPYRWEVEVLIDGPPAEVARRLPTTVAALTPAGDGVLLVARAERLDGMAHLLAALEWPFTIRRPDELRVALGELAQRLAAIARA